MVMDINTSVNCAISIGPVWLLTADEDPLMVKTLNCEHGVCCVGVTDGTVVEAIFDWGVKIILESDVEHSISSLSNVWAGVSWICISRDQWILRGNVINNLQFLLLMVKTYCKITQIHKITTFKLIWSSGYREWKILKEKTPSFSGRERVGTLQDPWTMAYLVALSTLLESDSMLMVWKLPDFSSWWILVSIKPSESVTLKTRFLRFEPATQQSGSWSKQTISE